MEVRIQEPESGSQESESVKHARYASRDTISGCGENAKWLVNRLEAILMKKGESSEYIS